MFRIRQTREQGITLARSCEALRARLDRQAADMDYISMMCGVALEEDGEETEDDEEGESADVL